jgi:hypothetical protein
MTCSRFRRRSAWLARRLTILAFLLCGATIAVAQPAQGALNIKWYSFKDSGCVTRVDPVTTIFWWLATNPAVQSHIPHHGGWGLDVQYEAIASDGQWMWDAGWCTFQWGAFADNTAAAPSRFHVRFRAGHYQDPDFVLFALATPHQERRKPCGHEVLPTDGAGLSGFDYGRNRLAQTMGGGGHETYYQYVGNAALMTQCTGAVAGSNGNARYTRIYTENGPT